MPPHLENGGVVATPFNCSTLPTAVSKSTGPSQQHHWQQQVLPQQQQQQQQTQSMRPPHHHCACQDRRSPAWQALTRFATGPALPWTYWMRPICTHGCDDADIERLDRVSFPDEANEQYRYTIEHGVHSPRAVGMVIVKVVWDNRTPDEKRADNATAAAAASGNSFFSRFLSCCGDTRARECEPPLPPRPHQCTLIAYCTGKVRLAQRCAAALVNSMCTVGCDLNEQVCGDISSIAVAPAWRKLGLGQLLLSAVMRMTHDKAIETRAELRQKRALTAAAAAAASSGAKSDSKARRARFWDAAEVQPQNSDEELDAVPAEIVLGYSDKEADHRPQISPTAVHITLCVAEDNIGAQKLYLRNGFVWERSSSETQEHYTSGRALFRMGTWVDYN